MESQLLTTNRKALTINLDEAKYGTFAEIGAGQETARFFFQAGASAGTIAKSISAYDMKFSDEIYGKSERYVSEERVLRMIDYEYKLLHERLSTSRGSESTFFSFANSVAAKSFRGVHDHHGWLGIRFQGSPMEEPSDIILHVRMLDKENLQQQQALGIIGVNLVHGAFYLHENPPHLIHSLLDNITTARIEVDFIRFSGFRFAKVNNRLMSLQLIQNKLTQAVMFSSQGNSVEPAEILYKKAVFVERGSFRPVTRINLDMIKAGLAQFSAEPKVQSEKIEVLTEITMKNLLVDGEVDDADFLARVDLLSTLGFPVLISNYPEYFRLASYFRRYTKSMIGITLGVNNLVEVFNEKYYENLDGGILESFGRLFRNTVKLYIYPMRRDSLEQFISRDVLEGEKAQPAPPELKAHELVTADNLLVSPHLRHLYLHLKENHYIESIREYNPELQEIFSRDILRHLRLANDDWEKLVPREVATVVKARRLFGYDTGGG